MGGGGRPWGRSADGTDSCWAITGEGVFVAGCPVEAMSAMGALVVVGSTAVCWAAEALGWSAVSDAATGMGADAAMFSKGELSI